MAIGINPTTGRPGPVPHPARDGDKAQARSRVNVEVRLGHLPRAATLPCVDCGHMGNDRRHEYDHHRGYAAEHHLSVEAVCSPCHSARAWKRGEIDAERLKIGAQARKNQRRTHCPLGHAMTYGTDGNWRCRECRLEYWRARGRARKARK